MKLLVKDLSTGQDQAISNIDVTTAGKVTTADVFSGIGLDLSTQGTRPTNIATGLWIDSSYDLYLYDGNSGFDYQVIDSGVSLGGDVSGTLPSSVTVTALQGTSVYASISPSSGDVLTWDAGNSRWDASTPPGLGSNFTVVDSTVDTSGLNTALSTYDVVYAEPGTYSSVTGKVTIPDNKQFIALGSGSYGASATYMPRFDLTTSASVYFEMGRNTLLQGMYMEFNAGSAYQMIYAPAASAVVRYCNIQGDSGGTAYYAIQGSFKEISHVYMQNCYGINLNTSFGDRGGTTEVSNCYWSAYTGTTSSANRGLNVSVDEPVFVHDCEFEGGSYGVYCTSDDAQFDNIRCYRVDDGTTSYGLWINAVRNTVSNVYVYNNNLGDAVGVYLQGNYHHASNVYAYDTSSYGIYINNPQYFVASGLYTYHCGSLQSDHGIYINGVDYATIADMGARQAGSNGIQITGATASTFTGITADTCAVDGIDVTSCNKCTFTSITANSNTGDGINVGSNQSGIHFDSVTVQDNGAYGFIGANGLGSPNNRLSDCMADGNTTADISLGSNWDDYSTPSGISTISAATDTDISSPSSGQLLLYDGTDSWDNKSMSGDGTITSAGALSVLKIHGDLVDTGSPSTDDKFVWDGSEWHHSSTSRVRAYLNSAQSISTATLTTIQFANESYDTLGDFNTGTYRFVAPVTGYYHAHATVLVPANATNWFLYINHNGTGIVEVSHHGTGSGSSTMAIDDVVYMTSSQYLEIQVFQFSGGSLILGSGSNHTFFTVTRMI